MLPPKPTSEMTDEELLNEIQELRTRRVTARQSASQKQANKATGTTRVPKEQDDAEITGDLAATLGDILGILPQTPAAAPGKKRGRPRKATVVTGGPDLDKILQGLMESQAAADEVEESE